MSSSRTQPLAKPTAWQGFMQLLLASGSEYSHVTPFFDAVLPEAQAALPCMGIAVVQSTPPDWVVMACSGVPSKHVPTIMAAEALDRESVVREQDWEAMPWATNYALRVQ